MAAQTLLSSLATITSIQSLKDLRVSLFDSSITCFLQPTKWNRKLANQSIYQRASCRIRNRGTRVFCEATPKEGDDFAADMGYSDLKPITITPRKKLAVFVSGGGSNFKAIHAATLNGSILGDVAVLVTNKEGCGGAAYARDNGLPVLLYPNANEEPERFSPDDLVNTLRKFKVDFVLLAGYLKLIPVELVRAYPKRILNIHPSLLPAFGGKGYYGLKVHRAVVASGARYSGPTIHFVDEEYDTGRILAQRVVPVCAFDTPEELAARVLHQEHRLYVDIVAALCEDRIIWRDDGVPLIESRQEPKQYS